MSTTRFEPQDQTPKTLAWLIFFVTGLIGLSLLWAHRTALPEVVRSPGQLSPLGALHDVGHFDGGVIERIAVRPGDAVTEGDVLAVIEQPDIEANIFRVSQLIEANRADVDRMRAVLEFIAADGRDAPPNLGQDLSISQAYLRDQITVYLSQRAALEARAQRAAASLSAARDVTVLAAERVENARARETRAAGLNARGITTITELERASDNLEQALFEAMQADIRVLEAENRHSETLAAIDDARIALQTQIQTELYRVRQDLERLDSELAVYRQSLARAQVVASSAGVVQEVAFHAPGEVVPQGATVATILPSDDQLVAKLRLHPRHIGHIGAETPVRLGLTTFDVRRYGHIDGEVLAISPTSALDENQQPFYEVTVRLAQDFVTTEDRQSALRAGMEVSAEFTSRDRTVLEYFAGPIQDALTNAFTERG